LQHIKPNPSKMLVIKDLICGKVIGYQKSLWFEKAGQFSFFLSLVFHFGFMQLFVAKTTPISYINLDVHDKHLCHGFCCDSQALCVSPTHQWISIEQGDKHNSASSMGYKCSLLHHYSPQKKPNRLMIDN
jgi:hypothetical protein